MRRLKLFAFVTMTLLGLSGMANAMWWYAHLATVACATSDMKGTLAKNFTGTGNMVSRRSSWSCLRCAMVKHVPIA